VWEFILAHSYNECKFKAVGLEVVKLCNAGFLGCGKTTSADSVTFTLKIPICVTAHSLQGTVNQQALNPIMLAYNPSQQDV